MNMQHGLLCSLTNKKADFVNSCPSYNHDLSVQISSEEDISWSSHEIKDKVSARVYERLRMDQNLFMALMAGLGAGLVGAILWGGITVITSFQIGYMAVAIGAGVGFAMRYAGKGIDMIFGIAGGVIAIASCALGNFLSTMGFVANAEGLGYIETLFMFDYAYLFPLMAETFSFMDILFYGIAGYEGYRFAFRTLTESELSAL